MAPAVRITDNAFEYRNSVNTNVAETFKKHGFKTPNRAKQAKARKQLNKLAYQ